MTRLSRWLGALLRRNELEARMKDEMKAHIELRAADLERSGVSAAEAQRRARADFGSMEGVREEVREALGLRFWDELRGDLRYAWRTLRGSPGYTAVAAVTLGLGIGATTAIFSVVNGVLLRPLPFPAADRLVQIASYPHGALALYQQATSYESVGAYSFAGELNLLSDGLAERIRGRSVSAGFFSTLGLTAQLGRTFQEGEDRPGAPAVAVISDGLWRRRFGADPRIVGRVVSVDGHPREIIGVAPRGFNFPVAGTEMWVPIVYHAANPVSLWNSPSVLIGRLGPTVSVAAANAEHRAMIPRVRGGFPWPMPDSFGTEPGNRVRPLQEVMTASVRERLLLLFGAVTLVLLVACANVANLNLTRMTARREELQLRRALGASRGRVVRQLVVEQLVLAGLGAALGITLAAAGIPLLVRWLPPDTARLDQVRLDRVVLGFTALAAVLAALVTALTPALRLSRRDPEPGAGTRGSTSGPERSRLAGSLVIAEVALAVVLVVGAGVLLRSLGALMTMDPGVRVDRLVSAKVSLDRAGCASRETAPGRWELPERCLPFFQNFQERLAATPGITRYALGAQVPLEARGGGMAMEVEDHPRPPTAPAHWLEQRVVTPEYFPLLGIPIEQGRGLTGDDRAGAPSVVVISRAVADHYWPGQNPIGKRIKPVWLPTWWTIVGVAANVPAADHATEPAPEFYSPLAQEPREEFYVLAETSLPPRAFEGSLRDALHAADPTVPVSRVRTFSEVRAESIASPRVTSILLGAFAALGLGLGAVGIYGVLSYGVTQRRKEIGIRMAVGAGAGAVRQLVLGRAARLIAAGLMLGLAGAWFAVALLRRLVYGIGLRDPLTFAAAAGIFLLVGLAAAYLPARRATRLPATVVLREG